MNSAVLKLAGFATTLAALFGIGLLAGGIIDPSPPNAGAADRSPPSMGMASEGEHGVAAMPVRGLAVENDGLRLVLDTPTAARGQTQQLRFRIVDDHGNAVRSYDVEHTKRMHLIVVRRDLTGFQHLHPTQQPDGGWTTPLRLDEPGSYRVFADFSHDGKPETLASDITVDGAFSARPLAAPQPQAKVDGFDVVRVARPAVAGKESPLRFQIRRAGRPVQVQKYLGADGHLVVLREGDLAFLHVHPTANKTFEATFPTPGRYRLFLQFKVAGKVHTVAFTEVAS